MATFNDDIWELRIDRHPVEGTTVSAHELAPRQPPTVVLLRGRRPVLTAHRAEVVDMVREDLVDAINDLNAMPALRRRLGILTTIIHNLATEDPERLCPDGLVRCQLCDADGVDPEDQSTDRATPMVLDVADHEPSCAWRLAHEYQASDPVHHSG